MAGSAEAWTGQSCRSAHRLALTLTTSAAGHTGEIRVDLSGADFPASYTLSPNGDDVRVYASDDVTPIDFVVTAWDPVARTATLYLRLAPLAGSTSTSATVYFGDSGLTPASAAPVVFPDPGLRLHSRVSTADPVSVSDALAAFTAATVDVYNDVRAGISGTNNRALGGTSGDYGWCVSAVLEVTPATAGTWDFRYGGDFGRGGHLFVGETQLEEQWNDDLWWANSFANTAETLEGSIVLDAGYHRYEALGFEGCCDGPTGWQARAPGGVYQDLTSANFPMRAVQCVNTTVTVSKGAAQSCPTTLTAAKDVDIVSDPMGNADPFALPGSVIAYDIFIENPGQPIDGGSLELVDALPAAFALTVSGPSAFTLTDGATASGLTLDWGGPADSADDVFFSIDGVDFTYTPTPAGANNTDPAVTHVMFTPSGTLEPFDSGNTPSFTIGFTGVVE